MRRAIGHILPIVISLVSPFFFSPAARADFVCPPSTNRTGLFVNYIPFDGATGGWDCYDYEAEALFSYALWANGYATPTKLVERTKDDSAEVTLPMLKTSISQKGALYLVTHGHEDGRFFCERFESQDARDDRFAELAAAGYDTASAGDPDIIKGADVGLGYNIVIMPTGIGIHLNTLSNKAIAYLAYCQSMKAADRFGSVADILGYLEDCTTLYSCDDQKAIWSVLSCLTNGTREPTTREAISGTNVQHTNNFDDVIMNCVGCVNAATLYNGLTAFPDSASGQTAILFQTLSEVRTATHTIRGYADTTAYPAVAESLMTLPATGGPGIFRGYSALVPAGYALYDVLETDSLGHRAWSEPVAVTGRPDGSAALANVAWTESYESPPSPEFYELIEDEWVPFAPAKRGAADVVVGKTADAPCSSCADYIVYTTDSDSATAFIRAVIDTLVAQGLDVRTFKGASPYELQYAQFMVESVWNANSYWNSGPGGASRPYPVNPGPTLVIVGDAAPNIVYPVVLPPEEHLGGANRHSYITPGDITYDGVPDVPVELIPASTIAEVQRLVAAGADVNRGRFVDADKGVLIVGGDRADSALAVGWMREFLMRTDTLATIHNMNPSPPIFQSEYPAGDDNAALQTATKNIINGGISEGWFLGMSTNPRKFPSWCISAISDPVNLTTKQRVIFWAPCCVLGSVWFPDSLSYNQAPTVEKLAFNDPSKTVMAGGVFHTDPGFEVKHHRWAEVLREARFNALPGTTVSRIHYDAVRAWFDQFPDDFYALSSVAIGCYVKTVDVATPVEDGDEENVLDLKGQSLVALRATGDTATFRFGLDRAAHVSLSVVDVSGRLVARVREAALEAGPHRYTWFGGDQYGKSVASGTYFGVLTTDDGRKETARVVIIR